MKTLTVRISDALATELETESRRRKTSIAAIVRGRLEPSMAAQSRSPALLEAISDLIGSIDGLPTDLSNKKKYLRIMRFGQNRSRRISDQS